MTAIVSVLALAAEAVQAAGEWTRVGGTMSDERYTPTVVALPDGRALVMGGQNFFFGSLRTVEVFNSATDTWEPQAAPMNEARTVPGATLLLDGRVLVAGGAIVSPFTRLASAEVYDPLSDTWTPVDSMAEARSGHGLVTLPDGRALAIGGFDSSSTELFDPTAPAGHQWTPGPALSTTRGGSGVVVLTDGRVVIAGGFDAAPGNSVDIFTPDAGSGRISPATAMSDARALPLITRLPGDRVLVAGGIQASDVLATAEIYDPTANIWTSVASMANPRVFGGIGTLSDGSVVVAAGLNSSGHVTVAEQYNVATDQWTPHGELEPRQAVGFGVVDGRLLLAGGLRGSNILDIGDVTARPNSPPTAVAAAIDAVQASLRAEFRDPLFTIPGGTPDEQLAALVRAITELNHGRKQGLYQALGGTTK